MARKRYIDDDLKITVRIKYGERTPQWDQLWQGVFLGTAAELPLTENDQETEKAQVTQEERT